MPDIQLDDTLRRLFRDEVASLPFGLTTEVLERRLAERRRLTGTSHRRMIAAAVVAVAVTGGAAFLLIGPGRMPSIGASPSPSPTSTAGPTNALPDASTLLVDVPAATLRLEGSVGPDVPAVDPASPAAPRAQIEAGRVTIAGPFVVAAACRGSGDVSVSLTDTSGQSIVQYTSPCDGKARLSEYLTDPPLSGSDGFLVAVSADPAASWRLAIGTYPEDLAVAPLLPSITPTDGWRQVVDTGVTLVSPTSGTGLGFQVPAGTTSLGVLVTCQGEATVAIEADASPVDQIACTDAASSHRLEIPAIGGERATVRASADGFAWLRIVVETEAESAVARPSAVPLPAAVADTPYSATSTSSVAIGTVGSNTQTQIPLGQVLPGISTGQVVPVIVLEPTTGASRLDLLPLPDGSPAVTIAATAQPALLLASWADSGHRLVFYAMTPDRQGETVQYHQVAFDGSGDRVIAESSVGAGRYLFGGADADLSRDASEFVMDTCDGTTCSWTILDTETGDVRVVKRGQDTFCSILGIADGTAVALATDACTPIDPGFSFDSPTRIVALPLDGSAGRDLVEDVAGGQVVATPTGARFVFTRTVAGPTTTIESLDIETGTSEVLRTLGAGDPIVGPLSVRLPDGWVLLATMSLGDFPQAALGPRAIPLLIDLVSGKSYELVNLPH